LQTSAFDPKPTFNPAKAVTFLVGCGSVKLHGVAMRGTVHHIDLTVENVAASLPFYEEILTFMGYARANEDGRGADWDLKHQRGAFTSIGIKRAEGDGQHRCHDRYSPGLHHLAWCADSRADVDNLYARLKEIGATILDAPAEYPRYGNGYYAVFFSDPDGLKLEYVHQSF
jgi:catechol 2,3-dioxygenase-like lactoylglutathione lyase family enzyme